MVDHRSVGFFGEICTARFSKYHLWKNFAIQTLVIKIKKKK